MIEEATGWLAEIRILRNSNRSNRSHARRKLDQPNYDNDREDFASDELAYARLSDISTGKMELGSFARFLTTVLSRNAIRKGEEGLSRLGRVYG